jgi:uncharacterized protein (DUF433 family)
MATLTRITFDPQIMGGKPCIRGMRVTVGTIVGLFAAGQSKENILHLYPYLESKDIDEALSYAARRVEEIDNPLTRQVRYLDKLVDELARGRKMEKILREETS